MAVLCVVGDLVEDVVVHLAGPPARGTDTPAVVVRTRGGSAANVAAAAATAGRPTRFIGRVGDDATGDLLVASLRDVGTGIDVRVQRGGRTGTVVVLVEPDGERTMLPDRAAAQQLTAVDPSWLAGVTWLHVPAYSLCAEPIGAATLGLIDVARRGGAGLSVDVSSVAVVEAFGTDRFGALLAGLAADVVFANAAEAALVAGVDLALLVVKDGPRDVELRHADGGVERVAVPPLAAAVVDTTGAGDAFAGGFLAATLGGAHPSAAAGAGAALAARTLAVAGAHLAPDAE